MEYVMTLYIITESLYNSNSYIILNNMTSDFFHNTVGVRQDCLLSPELFHIFCEQISCRKLSLTTCQLYLLMAGIQVILDFLTIDLITGRGSELQEQTYKYLGSTFKAGGSLDDEYKIR